MSQALYTQGDQIVFFAYEDEAMPESAQIFRPGELAVVAKVNEDGGLQCFPIDHKGNIVSVKGDTLFPEEVIRMDYAQKIDITLVSR